MNISDMIVLAQKLVSDRNQFIFKGMEDQEQVSVRKNLT